MFERFCAIDLRPNQVSNIEMGYLFEDLIRRFSEISNETAGEHFTPREVIRLIVELLLSNDHAALTGTGIIRTVYDPACGTGGMLALTEEAMTALNPKIRVELFGQELNGEFFGICKSDMLVTGHNPEQIAFGNTLTEDAHTGKSFHYMLSNPQHEPGSVDRLEGASGKITDEELERERGGSGLRYSFDIKSGGITQCVGTPRKAHTPTERELDGRIVVQTSGSPRPGEACGFSWSPASPRPCTIRGPSRRRGLDSIDGYGPRRRTTMSISVSSSDGRPSTISHRLVIRSLSEKLDDHPPRCQHPRNTLNDVASNDRRGRGSCCG